MPLGCGSEDVTPIPPVCWVVAEQVHPPPAASVQAIVQPRPDIPGPTRGHVVVVPEIFKHGAGNVITASPDVVVPSVYVPLELAVQVPLTLREPVIVALLQLRGSSPPAVMSRFPLNFRHDGVTVQVPTTSPPQGVTLAVALQDDPPLPGLPPVPTAPPLLELPPVPTTPPLLELPPVPTVPPLLPEDPPDLAVELPPVPDGVPVPPDVHAPEIIANVIAIAKTTDWTFIARLLLGGAILDPATFTADRPTYLD